MPWGTERHADQVIQVKDLSSFQVDITAFSPMNWNGRVQLTVLMEDTGVHTQAKVIIRKF